MALGGRPTEEGGHKRVKLSLNVDTVKAINEFAKQKKYKSKVVEDAIKPMKEEQDPQKRRRLLEVLLKKQ